jgi:hypothetical protein
MTESSKRDYQAERKYDSKPSVKANRAASNRARRMMINAGKARIGDGLDVGHKNNKKQNVMSNLRMESQHHNRSYDRTPTGRRAK